MSAAAAQASAGQQATKGQIGEWFWRFLAVVMLAVVGWVVWIAIQISPPEMVLPAAYEAAAQGRASRNSGGLVTQLPDAAAGQAVSDTHPAVIPAGGVVAAQTVPAVAAVAPALPPVNLEKLRLAETIDTPILERTKRPPKPAREAAQ